MVFLALSPKCDAWQPLCSNPAAVLGSVDTILLGFKGDAGLCLNVSFLQMGDRGR